VKPAAQTSGLDAFPVDRPVQAYVEFDSSGWGQITRPGAQQISGKVEMGDQKGTMELTTLTGESKFEIELIGGESGSGKQQAIVTLLPRDTESSSAGISNLEDGFFGAQTPETQIAPTQGHSIATDSRGTGSSSTPPATYFNKHPWRRPPLERSSNAASQSQEIVSLIQKNPTEYTTTELFKYNEKILQQAELRPPYIEGITHIDGNLTPEGKLIYEKQLNSINQVAAANSRRMALEEQYQVVDVANRAIIVRADNAAIQLRQALGWT